MEGSARRAAWQWQAAFLGGRAASETGPGGLRAVVFVPDDPSSMSGEALARGLGKAAAAARRGPHPKPRTPNPGARACVRSSSWTVPAPPSAQCPVPSAHGARRAHALLHPPPRPAAPPAPSADHAAAAAKPARHPAGPDKADYLADEHAAQQLSAAGQRRGGGDAAAHPPRLLPSRSPSYHGALGDGGAAVSERARAGGHATALRAPTSSANGPAARAPLQGGIGCGRGARAPTAATPVPTSPLAAAPPQRQPWRTPPSSQSQPHPRRHPRQAAAAPRASPQPAPPFSMVWNSPARASPLRSRTVFGPAVASPSASANGGKRLGLTTPATPAPALAASPGGSTTRTSAHKRQRALRQAHAHPGSSTKL